MKIYYIVVSNIIRNAIFLGIATKGEKCSRLFEKYLIVFLLMPFQVLLTQILYSRDYRDQTNNDSYNYQYIYEFHFAILSLQSNSREVSYYSPSPSVL